MSRSQELYRQSLQHIPGGVNSPVRAFNGVGGTPIFIKSAYGAIMRDVDENEYIDYIGSWGPMILGHAHPKVIAALKAAVENSTSFGAPTELELRLAELIKKMVRGVDKVRMVNSGTEACMSAIRLARAFTKKNKIIKFDGCYHGHADSFLVNAGSGMSTLAIQSRPGVPDVVAKDTLAAPFNDISFVEKLFAENKNEVAAIIVEPVAGNMGCVPPLPDFLKDLRDICDRNRAVLIFDEVMTGFRLAKGGAAEKFHIQPDLFTFGKIIGGGLPVGAYAGRDEIMGMVAPAGNVYQAGTLSGNPLAMTSGYVTLNELNEHPEAYDELEKKGKYLEEGLKKVAAEKSWEIQINRVGSMISLHFTSEPVVDFISAKKADTPVFKNFFHHMLDRGVYLPPSAFESWFISTAHSIEMLDKTIKAANDFQL